MQLFWIIAALLGFGGLVLGIGLSSAHASEDKPVGPPYLPEMVGPAFVGPVLPEQEQTDDVTALARMLASEDKRSFGARVVIAWITAQKAKSSGRTLYDLLTTPAGESESAGYGPQKRGPLRFYAATTRPYREEDKALAEDVLTGRLQPSAEIQAHGVGGWVERGGVLSAQLDEPLTAAQEDARILEKQASWGEGIYGRLQDTKWILFSRKVPILQKDLVFQILDARKNRNDADLSELRKQLELYSTSTLDAVPIIPALDPGVA